MLHEQIPYIKVWATLHQFLHSVVKHNTFLSFLRIQTSNSQIFNFFTCSGCNEMISYLKSDSYVFQCIQKFCIENMEMLPNCTCNICKGVKLHHGDFFTPEMNLSYQIPHVSSQLPPNTNNLNSTLQLQLLHFYPLMLKLDTN